MPFHNLNLPLPRPLLILSASLQSILASGLLYGWPSICSSLLTTPISLGGAGLSDAEVMNIFSIAVFFNFLSPLFLGYILDNKGPRTCSTLSNLIVSLGFFIMLLPDTNTHYTHYTYYTKLTSIVLISTGGPGVQNSLVHLSNLYPENKTIVTSIITGSFSLSFLIFALFNLIFENAAVDYKLIFGGYGIIVCCSAGFSWSFWPDSAYRDVREYEKIETDYGGVDVNDVVDIIDDDDEVDVIVDRDSTIKSSNLTTHYQGLENQALLLDSQPQPQAQAPIINTNNTPTFTSQLFSPFYIKQTILFVVLSYILNFEIGTISLRIHSSSPPSHSQHHQEELLDRQDHLVKLFNVISSLGVIGIPLVALTLKYFGNAITILVTIILTITSILTHIVDATTNDVAIMCVGFVSYSLARAYLYTWFFSSSADELGFANFGRLCGISFYISGTMQLSISFITDLVWGVEGGKGWFLFSWVEVGALVLLSGVPGLDLYVERKERGVND